MLGSHGWGVDVVVAARVSTWRGAVLVLGLWLRYTRPLKGREAYWRIDGARRITVRGVRWCVHFPEWNSSHAAWCVVFISADGGTDGGVCTASKQ